MSASPDKNPRFDPRKASRRHMSWSEPFPFDRADQNEALKNVIRKMRLLSFPISGSITPRSESEPESEASSPSPPPVNPDYTALLSDELMLNVLDRISESQQILSNSLVCKRWCSLSGKLIKSIRLLDWEFLESGRLTFRFPNLVDVNIVPACINSVRNSGVLLTVVSLDVFLNPRVLENDYSLIRKQDVLMSERINGGLRILAEGCRHLRRVALMNASEEGLRWLAMECEALQEMELHSCSDLALRGIQKCQNLQVLKLIGRLNGVYESLVSDIGMTILAQGCRRLLKLELVGCQGSYDGIKAIGTCCQMLAELTICDHRMGDGWLSSLSYCTNLKILRIQSCKYIDENPGPDEHLGWCPMLEELYLTRCQLRDRRGVRSLFLACRGIRGLVIDKCWGLDDGVFAAAINCRQVRYLSVEGCSLLTTEGLAAIILSWKEVERVKVVSCNNIKHSSVTPEVAQVFSGLKGLKWRPESRSMLSAGLKGTGIGQRGGRYFNRH